MNLNHSWSRATVLAALCVSVAWTSGTVPSGELEGPSRGSCIVPPPDSTESLAMGALASEPMEVTGQAPGAEGTLHLAHAPSPFDVAVAQDGRPRYRVEVQVDGIRTTEEETLVAWAATPDLDRVVRLGLLGPELSVQGELTWSRFLVFVTAETDPEVDRWSGPVLLVGRTPSSRMHTMRGHGIFEAHGIGC